MKRKSAKPSERSVQHEDSTKRADELAQAMMENAAVDETAAYLKRGQIFRSLANDELKLRWTAACKSLFASKTPERARMLDDLSAELRLRGLEPAHDTVAAELADVQAEIAAGGPKDPGIQEAVRKFLESLDKPSG